MDKVQVYYTILLAFGCLSVIVKSMAKPDELQSKLTNSQYVAAYLLAMVLNLPAIGRIYGWW